MAAVKGWHREDIKAALRKRYGSLSALAKSWGFNRLAISHALQTPKDRKRMAKRVAAALDVSPHELWPSIFEPESRPVVADRNRNRRRGGREQQKMEREVA